MLDSSDPRLAVDQSHSSLLQCLVVRLLPSVLSDFMNYRPPYIVFSVSSIVQLAAKAAASGDFVGVIYWYARLVQLGFKPSRGMLDDLVFAFARLGDYEGATEVISIEYAKYGMTLAARTFNRLLSTIHTQASLVAPIFHFMNRLGVEPDVFTFNIIITILAHSNHVNEALSYLRLMTSVYSLAPTGPTISIISRMLGAANMPDVADNIYKQLSHVQLSDASRESVVLSHLIRQPSSKLAQQLTSVILDSGSPVSQHFITTAITHIIRACGLEEGMDFAGWLEKSNLPTYNTHFVGVVLDALTKRRDYGSVIEVFNEWIVKGLPLDRLGTPLPLFLNACGALRRPGSAIRGWKKFRKAYPNFLIQDESYVALMVALGRGRKIGPALRVVADFLNARRKLGVTHVRLKIAQRLLHELFFARYMDIEELDRECKMVNSYAREQGNFLWVPLPVVERTLLVGRHLIAGHASMESIRSRPPLDIRELTMELLQLNTANTTALRTARSIADAQWVAEKAKKKKTEIASTPSTTEPPG